MELLKIVLAVIGLLYLYERTGIVVKKIVKSEAEDLSTTLLYGFITNFALFEVMNLPFILYFKQATFIMFVLFLIMNIGVLITSYIIKPIAKYKITFSVFGILAVLLIGFQIYQSAFLFKQDADDSFYISWANQAKELEDLYQTEPSVGLEGTTFDSKYQFNTWEIYGGFVARLLDMKVTTLFHTAYPILFIILAYASYTCLLKKLVKKENLGVAIFSLAMLFLLTGVSAKFKGTFLLGRIYQGKAILANIIIPFVMAKFLAYKNLQKEDYIILILTYVASLACTPMTISILSLLYGLWLVIMLVRKEIKTFKKAWMLMIPIVLIAMMYVAFAYLGNQTLGEATTVENFSQMEDFKAFLGEGKTILILYGISILVVLWKGNEEQKNIGVILPLILILLVFNPLLTKLYIKLVTNSTYWRLYWLVPIEITITMATILIYDRISERKLKYIFCVLIAILFMVSGKYMYTEERGFSGFENFEKIPQYIIDETHYIAENTEKKTKVVAPPEPWESCMMRQYNTNIILLHSRNAYAFGEEREKFEKQYQEIYFTTKECYDIEKINDLKEQYAVEWIILPKGKSLEESEELKYSIATENENNYILKVKE